MEILSYLYQKLLETANNLTSFLMLILLYGFWQFQIDTYIIKEIVHMPLTKKVLIYDIFAEKPAFFGKIAYFMFDMFIPIIVISIVLGFGFKYVLFLRLNFKDNTLQSIGIVLITLALLVLIPKIMYEYAKNIKNKLDILEKQGFESSNQLRTVYPVYIPSKGTIKGDIHVRRTIRKRNGRNTRRRPKS